MSKRIKKFIKYTALVILTIALVVFVSFQVSPKPSALIVKRLFSGKVVIRDVDRYEAAKLSVQSVKDLVYPSKYKTNTFDVYSPLNAQEKTPVLFWLHGGGFVGGDKESIEEFATYLVNATGLIVVSMNYQVAPDLHYPGQVEQVGELYSFVKRALAEQPAFAAMDLDRVMFGGDSAGAQIAAQFVTIQTNEAYASDCSQKHA